MRIEKINDHSNRTCRYELGVNLNTTKVAITHTNNKTLEGKERLTPWRRSVPGCYKLAKNHGAGKRNGIERKGKNAMKKEMLPWT